jgi:uncharacterized protein
MRLMAISFCFFVGVMGAAIVTAQHLTVVPGVPQTASSTLHEDLSMGQKILVIDVRTAKDFAEGHVPGAISIPLEEFQKKFEALKVPKDTRIVTVCDRGGRSSHAAELLEKLGYSTSSFCTLESWKKAGYPIEAAAEPTKTDKSSLTNEGRFKVIETPIQFQNRQGKWLRGMLHLPEGATKEHSVPAVVFFHGFTGDRIESHWIFVNTSRALAQAGIASLRFDFYGSGESEGQFTEMTLQGEIADAEDAVRFLRLQAGVDPRRIGLCGFSMGGSIAAIIAAPVQANAVVLWSAVAHMDHLRRVLQKNGKPIADTDGYLEFDAREVSSAFLNHLDEVDPVEAISRYAGPVLIIQPEKDEVVPLSHADDLFQAARTKDKEKFIVAGANHTYSSLSWESEVIRRTVDWFQKHLVH